MLISQARRFLMRSLWLGPSVVVVGLLSGTFQPVAAQGAVHADHPESDKSLSTELRFRLLTMAYNWSSYRSETASRLSDAKRSVYLVGGAGARFYSRSGHGALVDADYRGDMGLLSEPLFSFSWDEDEHLETDFVVAHAGYAYRHVIQKRGQQRFAWTLTPHASLAAGASFSEDGRQTWRSPVVGARFGLDIDLHINRFFMGWTLQYEFLQHTQFPVRSSHFLSWNLVPVFAIGANIGRKVQVPNSR